MYNVSALVIKVTVDNLSSQEVIRPRQLNQIDGCASTNNIVGVWPAQSAQPMVLLQLNHQVLCSNPGALIPVVSKLIGASSKLMLSKV